MRLKFDWVSRARHMMPNDIMFLGDVSASSVRESLRRLESDPDAEVAAKRFRVKSVPAPEDIWKWKAISNKVFTEAEAELKAPRGYVYICCVAMVSGRDKSGEKVMVRDTWPRLVGFPRAPKPVSVLAGYPETTTSPAPQRRYEPRPAVRQEDVPQAFPDDDGQAFPDYEGQSQAYRRR